MQDFSRKENQLRRGDSGGGNQGLALCSLFVHNRERFEGKTMDADKERQIIRLWNELRLLEREGRSTEAVRRRIESALAERESQAA